MAYEINAWSAGQDGTARLWRPLSLEEVIENACRVAGRNLTLEEWPVFMRNADYHQNCAEFLIASKPQ